jgi:hypothetical protein
LKAEKRTVGLWLIRGRLGLFVRLSDLSSRVNSSGREYDRPQKLEIGFGFEMSSTMADIVLVNPDFDTSYRGLEHALPLFGERGNVPRASLPLLAALTPSEHRVTLVDESVEALDFERLARSPEPLRAARS